MLFLSELLSQQGIEVVPFSMQDPRNLETPYSKFFVSPLDIHDPAKLSMGQKVRGALRIFYSFEAKRKIRALLQAKKVDVAHIHNIYNHISPSILGELKKNGVKIVMTLHDYNLLSPNYSLFHHGKVHEEDARGWYGSCIKNKCVKDSTSGSMVAAAALVYHNKIMKFYEKYVDVFIAPSECMRAMMVKYGWDAQKIVHIPNPLDAAQFEFFPEDDGTVVYSGRLSEEKGLAMVLEVAEHTPHIAYKIIGTGPMETELKHTVQEKNIQNVEFTGFKTGSELKQLLQQARIHIVPSIWYENCPLSILEAKALGKIVLASDSGGIPEMLPKHMLFTPGNVRECTEKIQYWHAAGAEQRYDEGQKLRDEVLQKNNPDEYLQKVLALYQD